MKHPASDTEFRFREERVEALDGRRLQGYPVVFNALSQDLGGFREIIDPRAVDRTFLESSDVRALVDHDGGKVVARRSANTLDLRKEARGLRAMMDVDPEISYVGDIIRSIRRGDVTGMSFGFRVLEDDWAYDGPVAVRTVLDMRIAEVSIVSFPAYTQTDVAVAMRSLAAFRQTAKGSRVAWLTKVHRTRLAR